MTRAADALRDARGDVTGAASAPPGAAVRDCRTCAHSEASVINGLLARGQSVRSIARQFGLSEASVRRHKHHVTVYSGLDQSTGDSRRSDAAPPEGADPLLWELAQLRKVAQGALAHAARTKNLAATASLLRAANGLLELLARIEKRVGPDAQVQVAVSLVTSPEWVSLQARIVQALGPFPEARQAVRLAIEGPRVGVGQQEAAAAVLAAPQGNGEGA